MQRSRRLARREVGVGPIGFLARLIEAPQHHGIDHGIKRLDSFDARFDRVSRGDLADANRPSESDRTPIGLLGPALS